MLRKKVILTFPPKIVEKPVTYQLIRDFGLWINILRAKIEPSTGGKLVLEIKGEESQVERGLKFVRETEVGVDFIEQEVMWNKDRCIDCGVCISICPTGALSLDKKTFKLQFNYEECVVCGYCVEACPLQAIKVTF